MGENGKTEQGVSRAVELIDEVIGFLERITKCSGLLEKLRRNRGTTTDSQPEIMLAEIRRNLGYLKTAKTLISYCNDMKISEEQCVAIGGHCWRENVAYTYTERTCIHCGKTQRFRPGAWIDVDEEPGS